MIRVAIVIFDMRRWILEVSKDELMSRTRISAAVGGVGKTILR